jgi:hypothetical protein
LPFTWLIPKAREIAGKHDGRVYAGGPGISLAIKEGIEIDWAETFEATTINVLEKHNSLATFTTRGCPNRCKFCAVPKIEGDFVELPTWKPAPIICDNNLLACSTKHFEKVIDSLRQFPFVDFNQGLDASLLKSWHVDLFRSLKNPIMRFSFDHIREESAVGKAVNLCLFNGFPRGRIQIYVLFGFEDTPRDAQYRLEKVREWGLFPNPMRYQPLNTLKKNSYIEEHWTERELFDYSRFYGRLRFWRKATYKEYIESGGFGNRKIET